LQSTTKFIINVPSIEIKPPILQIVPSFMPTIIKNPPIFIESQTQSNNPFFNHNVEIVRSKELMPEYFVENPLDPVANFLIPPQFEHVNFIRRRNVNNLNVPIFKKIIH
jgi:hypothetical protein